MYTVYTFLPRIPSSPSVSKWRVVHGVQTQYVRFGKTKESGGSLSFALPFVLSFLFLVNVVILLLIKPAMPLPKQSLKRILRSAILSLKYSCFPTYFLRAMQTHCLKILKTILNISERTTYGTT